MPFSQRGAPSNRFINRYVLRLISRWEPRSAGSTNSSHVEYRPVLTLNWLEMLVDVMVAVDGSGS